MSENIELIRILPNDLGKLQGKEIIKSNEIYSRFKAPKEAVSNKALVSGFLLAKFSGNRRVKKAFLESYAIILDIDNGDGTSVSYEDFDIPWRHLAYSTWSNSVTTPKAKIVIPLCTPLDASSHEALYQGIVYEVADTKEKLAALDHSSSQPYRFHYFPSFSPKNRDLFFLNTESWSLPQLSADEQHELIDAGREKGPVVIGEVKKTPRHSRILAKARTLVDECGTKEEVLKELCAWIRNNIRPNPELFLPGGSRYESSTLHNINSCYEYAKKEAEDLKEVDATIARLTKNLKKEDAELENEIRSAIATDAPPQAPVGLIENAPGLVGELLRHHQRVYKTLPAYSLASCLSLLSICKGRNYYIPSNMGKDYANLFILSIGKSGSGKQTVIDFIQNTFMQMIEEQVADCALVGVNSFLSSEAKSGTGIWNRLQDSKQLLLVWDEIGKALVETENPNTRGILSFILKAYSMAGKTLHAPLYSRSNKEQSRGVAEDTVKNPFLSIVGTTTPKVFSSFATTERIEDGTLSRWLMFYSPKQKKTSQRIEVYTTENTATYEERVLSKELLEALAAMVLPAMEVEGLFKRRGVGNKIRLEKDAARYLAIVDQRAREHEDNAPTDSVAILHSRFVQNLMGVCAAIAWKKDSKGYLLGLEELEWAVELVRYCFKCSMYTVRRAATKELALQDKTKQVMLNMLEVVEQTQGEIVRAFQGTTSQPTVCRKLKELVDCGLVQKKRRNKSGQRAWVYWKVQR